MGFSGAFLLVDGFLVSRLIIRRSLVRVQPAPPFALVKSHILDLGAFQFDMTRSLLPAGATHRSRTSELLPTATGLRRELPRDARPEGAPMAHLW